jgi:hypothetical protein
MGRKHDSANLISQRNTDCQPASAIANPYRLDPVTQCHTRHTIRPHDPVTLSPHAHDMA